MAINTNDGATDTGTAGNGVLAESRDGVSVMTLSGVVDIFEAGALVNAARQALAASGPVRVDLSRAERLDLSAWQVLCALSQATRAAGRRFEMGGAPQALARSQAEAGLTL